MPVECRCRLPVTEKVLLPAVPHWEKVHVWCEVYPEDTPIDISRDDLDFDVERGIYTYEMDPDGHGVVLTLRENGTGMFTIDAGPPVNDGFLVIIVVNP